MTTEAPPAVQVTVNATSLSSSDESTVQSPKNGPCVTQQTPSLSPTKYDESGSKQTKVTEIKDTIDTGTTEVKIIADETVAEKHITTTESPCTLCSTKNEKTEAESLERPRADISSGQKSDKSGKSSKRRTFVSPRSTAREASNLPSPWKECKVHRPTLEDLKSQSFTDFVRHTVLRSACLWDDNEELPGDDILGTDWEDESELILSEGMAKVVLPEGFRSEECIHNDRTGRGPAWQAGQPLGDYILTNPIQQHVLGLGGVYDFIFTEQSQMTIAEFRERADAYRTHLVGCAYEGQDKETSETSDNAKTDNSESKQEIESQSKEMDSDEQAKIRMAELERLFWKRLGPTMPPAWYGADEEGSFFGDDDASGWAVNKLDSCLHLLSNVPGVTTPYLYLGMWGACFAAHTEDINLLSINYLHAGAPKVWYAIAPGRDARRFEELAAFQYRQSENICKEFLRHKRSLLSPRILQKAGIPFTTMAQYPGDAMITFPGGYHFGFNTGYNVAEATNFGVPEWIPFGLRANVCLCRPDSVRIDVKRFIHVLKQYAVYAERQRRKGKRAQILSHKEWAETRQREKEEAEKKNASPETDSKKRKRNPTVQQQRKEFYVEVMKPSLPKKSSSAKKNGRSRGQKQSSIMTQKSDDVWHLAKPVCRKDLKVDDPVLVLLPAMVDETPKKKVWKRWNESSDEDDDDEEAEDLCFAGVIAEISDGHVRIHLKGLPKSEDVWTPINSSKFFVDGGQWRDQKDQALPELHYWKECDTKTLTA